MSAILQKAVDTVNSVAGTTFNIFSSFITFNYFIGDIIFNALQALVSICSSFLVSLFFALKIMLEDLLVFIQEIFEAVSCIAVAAETCLNAGLEFVGYIFGGVSSCIFSVYQAICTGISSFCGSITYCLINIRFFFDLLGRSIILLCNLIPRTLYIAYVSSGLLLEKLAITAVDVWESGKEVLTSASPPLLLGLATGLTSSALLLRFSARLIRERRVTWQGTGRTFLRLLCSGYVCFIRIVARLVGLIFTMVEMTISHLRVPMFAHAGDSDDEDEDRENLVGEVEEEREEERERQELKRRNYQLVVERAGLRRRGSNDSVEDQLLREVEREREDKLCVVCQDREKCIMILPCRHLCICENCQGPLRTHRNTCPICRRGVKQMIKAYL